MDGKSADSSDLLLSEAERVLRSYCTLKREFYMLEHLEGVIAGDKITANSRFSPERRPHEIRWNIGWKPEELTYTPLENISDKNIESGHSRDDLLEELYSHSEWFYRKQAYPYLRERHWESVDELKTACSSGTKKEMLKAVIMVHNQSDRSLNDRIFDCLDIQQNDVVTRMVTEKAGLAEMFDTHMKYAANALSGRLFEVVGETCKKKVKDRDGEQCVVCESTDGLIYHHIIPVNEGGSGEPENVAILCSDCHRDAHPETWEEVWYDSKQEFWGWAETGAHANPD